MRKDSSSSADDFIVSYETCDLKKRVQKNTWKKNDRKINSVAGKEHVSILERLLTLFRPVESCCKTQCYLNIGVCGQKLL